MTPVCRTLLRLSMLAALSSAACQPTEAPDKSAEPSAPAFSATQWRVHTHDHRAEAFDVVYEQARATVASTHELALLTPAAAPQAIDKAALTAARGSGELQGVDTTDLVVVDGDGEGFVVLVRGGGGFVAKRLIVPASAHPDMKGDSLVTFSARHVRGAQSSAMGDALRVVPLGTWLEGGAS